MIRVVIADDHTLVRAGLRRLLEEQHDIEVVAEARTGREALDRVETHAPDVCILDLAMPDLNGFEVLTRLADSEVAKLVLSMHEDVEFVRRVFSMGADGYLVKAGFAEELGVAVHAVAAGQRYVSPKVAGAWIDTPDTPAEGHDPFAVLTPRQREVLQLVVEGHSTAEIAERLFVSVKTVESHRLALKRRLGIDDVAGLVRYAIRHGMTWVDP